MPNVETFFPVTTSIESQGTPPGDFGLGLLLTTAADFSAGGASKATRFDRLASLQEVTEDVNVLASAVVWFGSNPPPRGLLVGRWATADVSTTLRGGAAPIAATASPLTLDTGSFSYNGTDFSPIALSSAATLADVATVIQTAIAASITGATFVYDTDRFLLTLPDAQPRAAYFGPHSAGTGDDISEALGMAQSQNPRHVIGHDMESAAAAVAEMRNVAVNVPFTLMRDEGTPDTLATIETDTALRAYTQANGRMIYGQRSSTQAPIQDAWDLSQDKVLAVLTDAGELPEIGALARLSAIDYEGFDTQISLFAKPLPNVRPTAISDSLFADLQAIQGNVYTNVRGAGAFVEGFVSAEDRYADEIYWLLWAQWRLSSAAWDAARQSRRLTRARLRQALAAVMEQGVANGGLSRGKVVLPATAEDIRRTTGNTSFTGTLTNGYLIHVGRVVGRKAPVKIWAAGSEAIHRANTDLVFLNDLADATAEAA